MIVVLVRVVAAGENPAMKLFFLAVSLAFCTTAALADPPAATDPAREKKELRLVEILHTMNKKPPPDAATQKALGEEYTQLLAYFGGVDLKNPPKDPAAQQKAQDAMMAAQGEILGRRDPALRDQMLKDLKVYQCKSKQIEARSNLKGLVSAEVAYLAEKDAYSKDLQAVGAFVENKRYDIAVTSADAKHFKARATGKAEMAGDVWEIDETGTLKAVTDLCAGIK